MYTTSNHDIRNGLSRVAEINESQANGEVRLPKILFDNVVGGLIGYYRDRARHRCGDRRQLPSTLSCFAVNNSASIPVPFFQDDSNDGRVPTPVVVIDQDSDPEATVVEITFGDRLGALLDTMKALRDLGLSVVKGIVEIDSSGIHKKFSITHADTGRKIEDPELLEAIRLTVINNLLKYHPESSTQLAMGEAFGIIPPTEKPDVDISTHINIYNDNAKRSLLCIETADRPGLLMEVVKAIADINVSVESGEFDTQGLLAKAKFHVSYHGSSLSDSLKEVLTNSLRYFLRRPSTEESSF